MNLTTYGIAGLALISALGMGCSDGKDSDRGATGSLSLSVTDAPVDNLLSVFISFTGVTLQAADGKRTDIVFPQPKTLDLLTLQNGMSHALLEDVVLPAGAYSWMRLDLSEQAGDLTVVDDLGGEYLMTVPSGAQTGLKLVGGFTILANGQSDFTIDFDLRKSVTLTGKDAGKGDYVLRPTLRLIDNAEAGGIGGMIATTTMQAACTNEPLYHGVVYVFEGLDRSIEDYNAETGGALVAVPVIDSDNDGNFNYTAAFLPAGDYTVAYTCDIDDLAVDESLVFTAPANATVIAGGSATVNF